MPSLSLDRSFFFCCCLNVFLTPPPPSLSLIVSLYFLTGAPPDHGSYVAGESLSNVCRLDALDVGRGFFSALFTDQVPTCGSGRVGFKISRLELDRVGSDGPTRCLGCRQFLFSRLFTGRDLVCGSGQQGSKKIQVRRVSKSHGLWRVESGGV